MYTGTMLDKNVYKLHLTSQVIQVSYNSVTSPLQVCHKYLTSLAQVSYKSVTSPLQFLGAKAPLQIASVRL